MEEANELPELSAFFLDHSSEQTLAFFSKGNEDSLALPPVQLLGFGKGQILLDGREVRMNSKKARELIFFLLEEKSPVGGERISATLWPDADLAGGGLGSGFYSTITHARKALGGPDTVRAASGCYSLSVRYRYDVEEFEQKLNRAERQFDPLVRIELLESALELYSSDFLGGGEMDWMQVRRQALREKWLKALRLLAETYTAARRPQEALDSWFKAMNAEPFDEQPLRSYTTLLAEIKSKTIAVNFLRRKVEALQDEGIQPEDATMELLDTLNASRTISKRRA
jgi:two-component SAPR family response regulator